MSDTGRGGRLCRGDGGGGGGAAAVVARPPILYSCWHLVRQQVAAPFWDGGGG